MLEIIVISLDVIFFFI